MTDVLDRPVLDSPLSPSPEPAPGAERGGRIVGIDIARGLALLGMMTVHVFIGGDNPPGAMTEWLLGAPSGQASVLFFVLSGVSLSVITQRGSVSSNTSVLRRRGVVLLILGLLLTATAWGGSILEYYGMMFLLAPWLLRLGRRALAGLALFGTVLGPVILLLLQGRLPWIGNGGLTWPATAFTNLWIDGTYPLIVWIGFFALGVMLGRLDLGNKAIAGRLFAGGVAGALLVTGVLLGLNRAGLEAPDVSADFSDASIPAESSDGFADGSILTEAEFRKLKESGSLEFFDPDLSEKGSFGEFSPSIDRDPSQLLSTEAHSNEIGWTLRASSIAVAILGATLLLPSVAQRLLSPLAALGSISLTAYLLHIPFVTDGWNWIVGEDPTLSTNAQVGVLLGMLTSLVLIGWAIVHLMGTGPAERLLKSLSR